MNTYKQRAVATFLVVATIITVVPNIAMAQSSSAYQPQSNRELIAYLLGRIEQLQEMQRLVESNSSNRVKNTTVFNYVAVDTHKADKVEEVTAVLRGEVNLFGDASATAWFEYGRDEDFLDFRTRKISVRSAYDRAIRTPVRGLEDNKRYYFRLVAQDKTGTLIFGEMFEMRTDDNDDDDDD